MRLSVASVQGQGVGVVQMPKMSMITLVGVDGYTQL
jgi:hypothetical protein